MSTDVTIEAVEEAAVAEDLFALSLDDLDLVAGGTTVGTNL